MRALSLLLLLAFATGSALAQDTSQNTIQTAPDVHDQLLNKAPPSRVDQRIEHIRVEDGGSRVDELRVGGETKSIKVQPKTAGGGVPEYEVLPNNGTRDGGPSRSGADTITAPRVWTLRKF